MAEETMSRPISKRLAVITGANKGIGLEISRQLASNRIMVILTARDEKNGLEAVAKLKESGISDVVFHQLDVKDSISIASLADFIKTQFGKLDILVNNAGVSGVIVDCEALRALKLGAGEVVGEKSELVKGVMQQTYEKAEECLKTNYYGCKAVIEALLPLLQLSSSARIVNVSSNMGQLKFISNPRAREYLDGVDVPTEEKVEEVLQWFLKDFKEDLLGPNGWPTMLSAYSVSKAALNAYTRILAKKYPGFCINCVNPGFVKTDINCNTGILTVEDGAKAPVMLALLPDSGPSGLFFDQMELSTFA
ncbi:salutaridine reductase-like isoform X1 [Magnolia sinica]|uniref:salutaridine reductase-like isoform X1 n=1 Tax=Magnolia sinica TaxID=86752 RepID=UPI0026582DC9|nr:salutaridine reductase-like isoform X1 [Magnolia sinica]